MSAEHFDVLIIGAGLSGVGAACHLQFNCPGKTYAILERRATSGGTWDLFRYPGIRSDSDMYTLGYAFKPWTDAKAIADGSTIRDYIRETAREYQVEQHIRYHCDVRSASWSTETARWTIELLRGATAQPEVLTCNFLFMCAGYYRYDQGYTPDFPGSARFAGQIVHPQLWTDDISTAGKRVVVIGSGATAVTLVPSIAENAAHVTMLQRSPTYVVSRPAGDPIADRLRRFLPERAVYALVRWKNVLLTMFIFQLSRRRPEKVREWLLTLIRQKMGPDYDVDKHFAPTYKPWDQRLCAVPDNDLFNVIKAGKASVVTDQIDTFTETGIQLKSGEHLAADMIVTATGLEMQFLGGMSMAVDGKPIDVTQLMTYKGMMFSDVPNLTMASGYTNASWTLKCDLTSEYACRLIRYMDKHGFRQCTPRHTDPTLQEEPFFQLTSGYIQRAAGKLPKQGSRAPWKLHQNYFLDLFALKFGKITDPEMVFSNPAPGRP